MNKAIQKFVTDVFSEGEANVIVFGVDCPPSLREASRLVEPFDIIEERNLLENVQIFDSGDIEIEDVEERTKRVVDTGKIPLILAKEHTATLHTMKSMPAGTKMVVFDAHADVKDEYEGSKQSHACWLRRWCELSAENCKNIAVIGVRSGEEDELEFMKSNGIMYFTIDKIKNDLEDVKKRLQSFVGDSPVYVSLDMDVFEPSIAPAVKYPEPEGMSYSDFVDMIGSLRGSKLVGMDCVEIRPIEGNKITEFLAVKSIFKILGMRRA